MAKDPWDNYNGLQVPPKHGDLFRAMDQQERFFAEVMKMNEVSIKNALNQATQKAIGELNIIKDNHLSVFNSIVLHKMSSLVDASIIVKPTMLATPIIVNLNLLNINISAALSTPGVLEQNLWLKEAIKTPNLFADYNKIYFYITNPFNVVTQELVKAKSEIEVNSIKQTFLTNLNHLDEYFEYTEGSNNQSPSSQIQCKESLLETLEDISSKITGFNKMIVIPRVLEEEKTPNDDVSDNAHRFYSDIPSVQSETIASEHQATSMTELKKALARITELETENVKLKQKVNNPIRNNDDENILRAIAEAEAREKIKDETIQKMIEDLTEIHQESTAKDGVIAEQAKENTELRSELHHTDDKLKTITEHNHELRQDKMELREQVKEYKDLAQEWKFMVKEKNEIFQKLAEDLTTKNEKIAQLEQQLAQLYLPHSSNQSHTSWENVDQEDITIPGLIGDVNVNYS